MKLVTSQNPCEEAGRRITEIIEICKNVPLLMLLPGGSSLKVFDYVASGDLLKNCTIAFGDELYLADEGKYNYDVFVAGNFGKKVVSKCLELINPKDWLGHGVEQSGVRLNEFLRSWLKENLNGKVLLIAGFGPDGHTYAVYPEDGNDVFGFDSKFDDDNILAIGHSVGKKGYAERFTITLPMIRRADFAVVQGSGTDKLEALRKIFSMEGDLKKTPARIYREVKDAIVFSEQAI